MREGRGRSGQRGIKGVMRVEMRGKTVEKRREKGRKGEERKSVWL